MLCLIYPCSRAQILYAVHPPLVLLTAEIPPWTQIWNTYPFTETFSRILEGRIYMYTACYNHMCIHTCIFVVYTFLHNFIIIYMFKTQVTGRVKWSKSLTKKLQHRFKTCSEFLLRAVFKEATVCWLAELRNWSGQT